MGIYSDLRATATTMDFDGASIGEQRHVVRGLAELEARQGDLDYPSGLEAEDEVQTIAKFVVTEGGTLSGSFDLTINVKSGAESISFTAAEIAFGASAATIESAIDAVSDQAAGVITVSGGPMDTANVVLTFDGAAVAGLNHPLATTDVTGIADDEAGGGAVTVTNEGQTDRSALAVLVATGVITNSVPVQGVPGSFTANAVVNAPNTLFPSQLLIRALAKEAAAQDELFSIETSILAAVGLS